VPDQEHPKTGEVRPTNKPVTISRYSDTLLMFLLKALRPEKYCDNWKGAAARQPKNDFSRLSHEEFDMLHQLARKAHGLPPTQ
jgi:hypothetical protein